MFLLLRALPGMIWVDFEEGKWGRGFTTLQGVEPWKASWQWVQKSKRQLGRVHMALWTSAKCVAGDPQCLHWRRDSCCFRPLATWTEEQNRSTLVIARVQRVKCTFMHWPWCESDFIFIVCMSNFTPQLLLAGFAVWNPDNMSLYEGCNNQSRKLNQFKSF